VRREHRARVRGAHVRAAEAECEVRDAVLRRGARARAVEPQPDALYDELGVPAQLAGVVEHLQPARAGHQRDGTGVGQLGGQWGARRGQHERLRCGVRREDGREREDQAHGRSAMGREADGERAAYPRAEVRCRRSTRACGSARHLRRRPAGEPEGKGVRGAGLACEEGMHRRRRIETPGGVTVLLLVLVHAGFAQVGAPRCRAAARKRPIRPRAPCAPERAGEDAAHTVPQADGVVMDHRLLLALPLLSLAAPVGQDPAGADPDGPLAPPKGLEKVQLVIPEDNPLTVEKAELGKMLFFDTRLSKDGSMSCQTCHVHEKAWSDGIALSTKVDGTLNTRNSPSLYNVGYQPLYYWDGRAPTMEANVAAAWKGHMGGDPDAMAAAIAKVEGYATAFEAAYGQEPSGELLVDALCAFVRSLQAGGTRYDEFQAGNESALSADERAGHELFLGKAGCVACHTPPLFTDFAFHNVGV